MVKATKVSGLAIFVKFVKKAAIIALKQLDLGSALAVRVTNFTGKSRIPIHPKHFLTQTPWFASFLTAKDLVLDLGCGNGQNTLKAAKIVRRVTGVEIDKRLLSQANFFKVQKKAKNVDFRESNLEGKLKFENNTFDKVMLLDVLEHLRSRDQLLTEIRRILKPGGLLLLGVPNSQTSWKKLQRSVGLSSLADPDHKIEFSQNSIEKLLAKHNFKIIHLGYAPYDTFLRGLLDAIGGFSLSLYKFFWQWRLHLAQKNPSEAVGFEIVVQNQK